MRLWPWSLKTVGSPQSSFVFKLKPKINPSHLAGGQAVNSQMDRMLTVVPEHIHDRSGIFMGSYDEVQKVIDVHKQPTK